MSTVAYPLRNGPMNAFSYYMGQMAYHRGEACAPPTYSCADAIAHWVDGWLDVSEVSSECLIIGKAEYVQVS